VTILQAALAGLVCLLRVFWTTSSCTVTVLTVTTLLPTVSTYRGVTAMFKKRARVVVEFDLDPVPGWGNSGRDWQGFIQRLLDERVGHYNPSVTVEDSDADR
jgi:hypothetical protein